MVVMKSAKPATEGNGVSAGEAAPLSNTRDAKKSAEVKAKSPAKPRSATQSAADKRAVEPDSDEYAQVVKKLDDLLDDDNYAAMLEEARKLKTHPNAEVRSRVAFALQWAELEGLSELTSMLVDPDPEVAKEVLDYWKMQLSSIEDSADKAGLLGAAVQVLGKNIDEEMLDTLLFEFSMVDGRDAMQHLMDILEKTDDPAQIKSVLDTMEPIMNSDEALKTKEDAEKAYQQYKQEQAKQDALEAAESRELP